MSRLSRALLPLLAAAALAAGCKIKIPVGPPGVAPDSSFTLPDGATWEPVAEGDALGDTSMLSLAILAVEPDHGPVSGLEKVRIEGRGFLPGTKVFFGAVEAPEVYVQGDQRITVRTPPHPRATVHVKVERPDGRLVVLAEAYRYESQIVVSVVEPSFGRSEGGTPLWIHGSGFTEGANVLVGERLAPRVEVVDATTILAIAPVGREGPADVFVTIEGQVGRLRDGFLYVSPPSVERVFPSVGPASGGTLVALVGKGLRYAEETEVWFGTRPGTDPQPFDKGLSFVAPPARKIGSVDLKVRTPYGTQIVPRGYTYVADAGSGLRLIGLSPAVGDIGGGTEVDLKVAGVPAGSPEIEVRFGTAKAEVVEAHGSAGVVRVVTPPGEPGAVDVHLEAGAQSALLARAFSYTYMPRVDEVVPSEGPRQGGTEVTIRGSGFFDGAQVRFGALPAAAVERVDLQTLRARTPPGAPGSVPVSVEVQGRRAELEDGFTYASADLQVFLLHPARGARAGGTYFRVVGAGFLTGTRVFIGDREAQVSLHGSQLLTGFSPRGVPGLADVTIRGPMGDERRLRRAWQYFDPTATQGGTWGDPVDEAVNVTVLQAGGREPVMGAFVTIGADPDTPHRGSTDLNGQVTLSGPGLRGPVTVTAAKLGYTAYSVVEFDAENVTVYLVRLDPSQPGGPSPPIQTPDSQPITVSADFVGKYLMVPPGQCDENVKTPETGVEICAACSQDSDCGDGICVTPEEGRPFCTRTCAGPSDCPEGFECFAFGAQVPICLPEAGDQKTFCFVSQTSIFSAPPEMIPVTEDEAGLVTLPKDATRLGDVAVVCQRGVVDPETEEFTPVIMGISRHTIVSPEGSGIELSLLLDIPLTDHLDIRLGNPLPEEDFPRRSVKVFLDLGSDGIIPLGVAEPRDEMGALHRLEGVPASFTGDLSDADLTFHVDLRPPEPQYTPSAEVLLDELVPSEVLQHVMLAAGPEGYELRSIGRAPSIDAAASSDTRTFAVGAEGTILFWNGRNLIVQSSPTREDLHGVAALDDGSFLAVGDRGTALSYDGVGWRALKAPADADLHAVADAPGGPYVVGEGYILKWLPGWDFQGYGFPETLYGVAVGAGGVVRAVGQESAIWRRSQGGWTKEVFPTPDGRARDLYAIDALGDTFAVSGERGVVALREGTTAWELLPPPCFDSVRALRLLDDGTLVAGGPRGRIYHWTGESWRELHSVNASLGTRAFIGPRDSLPILALGHHEVYLGPLLDPPVVERPSDFAPLNHPPVLLWEAPDRPAEALNYVRLSNSSGYPMWTVVAPEIRRIELPDIAQMAGFSILDPGERGSMRFVRALAPNFNIHHYSNRDLSLYDWLSWVTMTQNFATD